MVSKPNRLLLLPVLFVLCFSCHQSNRYPYAIRDFRAVLQPHLIQLNSTGIVVRLDSTLRETMTDKELMQLGASEQPLLRASAYREMLRRKSFNQFDLVMHHLDDTATVPTYAGEFGIKYRTVSDYILERTEWPSKESFDKTVDEVLTRHNYLRGAYRILLKLPPDEKYYPFIKDMATRSQDADEEDEWTIVGADFGDVECALYGLAAFKKKSDVPAIKKQLLDHLYGMGEPSFHLIKEFPDTAYLDVLEKWYKWHFYSTVCSDNPFQAVAFINTVVVYKEARSAKLLDSIPYYLHRIECRFGSNYLEQEYVDAVWNNSCPAYMHLREKVKDKAKEYGKWVIDVQDNPIKPPNDTVLRWPRWGP